MSASREDSVVGTSQHLDAQVGVIGSLLLDAEKCAGEIFLRTREDQYTGEYRSLFRAARTLHQEGRPIDPVTVRGIAGEEYTGLILQIMDLTPTAANYKVYVDLLIEQAQVAKIQALGLAMTGCKTTEEARDLLEEANRMVVQQSALREVSAAQGGSPSWTSGYSLLGGILSSWAGGPARGRRRCPSRWPGSRPKPEK